MPKLHLLCLMLLAACGGGGGSTATDAPLPPVNTSLTLTLPSAGLRPEQLAIIVAQGDPVSEAMGQAYRQARGVPEANLIRIPLATGSAAISASDFAALRGAVEAALPAGVQASLLAWSSPSRVRGENCQMGITSAMAFGYEDRYCVPNNICRSTVESPLFDREGSTPRSDFGVRPSMLLGSRTLAQAEALIARGLAAEASRPSGTGYLLRTSDALRSVRASDFSPLPAQWTGSLDLRYIDNSDGAVGDALRDINNVLFYFTGLPNVPDLNRVGFRPGALADHLTSYGGFLPDGGGQMPVTAWLDAGASASYGTVEEPCNLPHKFSQASVLIDHYWRGNSAIEAYWKSVRQPGQGLFVGDPLARPFAEPSLLSVEGRNYRLRSRALRPGARYTLEYRIGSAGDWTVLAEFTGQRGQALNALAPLAPAAATELRWRGPCATELSQRCTLASSSAS